MAFKLADNSKGYEILEIVKPWFINYSKEISATDLNYIIYAYHK